MTVQISDSQQMTNCSLQLMVTLDLTLHPQHGPIALQIYFPRTVNQLSEMVTVCFLSTVFIFLDYFTD